MMRILGAIFAVVWGQVAAAKASIVGRRDYSSTQKAKVPICTLAGIDISTDGPRYQSVGAGMGVALNTAARLDAYSWRTAQAG